MGVFGSGFFDGEAGFRNLECFIVGVMVILGFGKKKGGGFLVSVVRKLSFEFY